MKEEGASVRLVELYHADFAYGVADMIEMEKRPTGIRLIVGHNQTALAPLICFHQ